jgi:formylglycine-generating enzyme required for sulfatase activity/ankyrin repeat protein
MARTSPVNGFTVQRQVALHEGREVYHSPALLRGKWGLCVRRILHRDIVSGRNGRRALLRLLCLLAPIHFCAVPPAAADVYKCARADGSAAYSDTPCDPNAERAQVETAPEQSSPTHSGLVIQSAAYVSPRNGRELDVTSQLNSMCPSAAGSCTLRCGNQLAGDPDFGQRKYCRISYRCGGGNTQELRIQEGGTLQLSCPHQGALVAANPGIATPKPLSSANTGPLITPAREADRLVNLVREGSIEKLAAYLATPGVDINARPDVDKALLDYAAEQNQVAVATWLLDHGANVNGEQRTGRHVGLTALHRAAFFGSFEVAQLLIARGADVNADRSRGTTPLFYAASGGHGQIVELLLKNGADIEARTGAGQTAVSTAAQQGHLDIINLLEAHGAIVTGDQALSEAAFNEHADVVRYLLGHDQSQMAKDKAMRFAVLAANPRTDGASLDLVSMLIAAGADVNNTVNAAPNTPLMMAKRAELRELLLAHGALDFAAVRARQTGTAPAPAPVSANALAFGTAPIESGPVPPGQAQGTPSAVPPTAPATPAQERLATQLFTAWNPVTAATTTQIDWEQGAKLEAGSFVHDLDPNNPGWSPTHPKWNTMLALVASDLAADLTSESGRWKAQIEDVMVGQFAQRLTAQELRDLTHYFSGDTGKRYLAFEAEIAPLDTHVMRSLLQRDPVPASTRPPESVLKERLRLLSLSTNAQLTQAWFDEAQRTHGDTSGFQAYGFLAGATAITQGPALDAIGERYAADLGAFESFNKTPLAHRFYAAFGAASLAIAPLMQSFMGSFQHAEQAKYGERWESAYRTTVVESDRAAAALAAARRPTTMPNPGTVLQECQDCPKMIVLPGGTFRMGSPDDESGRPKSGPFPSLIQEGPVHEVQISSFAVGIYKVTRREFNLFVKETGYRHLEGGWPQPQEYQQNDDHPVVGVVDQDIAEYLRWLVRKSGLPYRLPSEAEWEYAARAGTEGPHYWGADMSKACEYENLADESFRRTAPYANKWSSVLTCDDGFAYTSPVGHFKPNPFGLYDMLGDASEIVADCMHHEDYSHAPVDGSAWLKTPCTGLMVRGGNWATSNPRVAQRSFQQQRSPNNGFRVARSLP